MRVQQVQGRGWSLGDREQWCGCQERVGVGVGSFVPVRIWKYDYGNVFWINGGIESTPMYWLL